jgi:DNA-binding response OmpR family regulator
MRVLVVDHDAAGARSVVHLLRQNGYGAWSVGTGQAALELHHQADLVLLDLGLPDVDGLQVCADIRAAADTPIIAVTEHTTELERVLCLKSGCDDCLDKPYGVQELIARIEAVLRRARVAALRSCIVHGPLRVDAARREVYLSGRLLSLTRKEFDLLHTLASRPGTVFSRRELMARVWQKSAGATAGRTIDTHVNSLRNKLGDSSWILTVRGVGFRLGRGMTMAA